MKQNLSVSVVKSVTIPAVVSSTEVEELEDWYRTISVTSDVR
jgi:hypothetical protein